MTRELLQCCLSTRHRAKVIVLMSTRIFLSGSLCLTFLTHGAIASPKGYAHSMALSIHPTELRACSCAWLAQTKHPSSLHRKASSLQGSYPPCTVKITWMRPLCLEGKQGLAHDHKCTLAPEEEEDPGTLCLLQLAQG